MWVRKFLAEAWGVVSRWMRAVDVPSMSHLSRDEAAAKMGHPARCGAGLEGCDYLTCCFPFHRVLLRLFLCFAAGHFGFQVFDEGLAAVGIGSDFGYGC